MMEKWIPGPPFQTETPSSWSRYDPACNLHQKPRGHLWWLPVPPPTCLPLSKLRFSSFDTSQKPPFPCYLHHQNPSPLADILMAGLLQECSSRPPTESLIKSWSWSIKPSMTRHPTISSSFSSLILLEGPWDLPTASLWLSYVTTQSHMESMPFQSSLPQNTINYLNLLLHPTPSLLLNLGWRPTDLSLLMVLTSFTNLPPHYMHCWIFMLVPFMFYACFNVQCRGPSPGQKRALYKSSLLLQFLRILLLIDQ